MGWLVAAGAALSLLGLVGIIYCIVIALRIKRSGASDEDIRARLKGLVAINLGAFFLSAFGLMMVVFGVILS